LDCHLVRKRTLRRQLGPVQKLVLRHLATSEHGTWHAGTGWIWEDRTTMIRVLSSLERMGLVEKFAHPQHPVAYRITELGKKSPR
jgi:DNA-binding MarR family transcriptional regulator